MTNPTPTDLKLVAEYVGRELFDSPSGQVLTLKPNAHYGFEQYTGTTPYQSMELLKMLLDKGYSIGQCGITKAIFIETDDAIHSYEKQSLELAIFNAALSHITATQGEC